MTLDRFAIGSRVFYVLSRGNGRSEDRYLAATIVNKTPKRYVIRVDGSKNHRNVLSWALTERDREGNEPPAVTVGVQ